MEPPHRRFVSTELPFVVPHGRSTNTARIGGMLNAADLVAGCRLRDPPPSLLQYPPEFWEPKEFSACVMAIRTGVEEEEGITSQGRGEQGADAASSKRVAPSLSTLSMNVIPRNDLVLSIKRRVRRVRSAETGEILSTDVLSESFEWVGAVSRSMSIARPCDFVVFPWWSLRRPTQSDHPAGASTLSTAMDDPTRLSVVREGDMFAPRAFLSERSVATFPYRYHGRTAATTALGEPVASADRDGGRNVAVVVKAPAIHSTDVAYPPPTRGARFPPQPSAPQREYLARLPSNFPAHRVVSELLSKRPIWRRSDLLRAVSATGLCPFSEANKNIIHSMTYSITKGPFQRLRIAYGSDPTTSSARYAVYQRLTIRIMRTSRLGVAIRDAARVPGVRELLAQYLHDNDESTNNNTAPKFANPRMDNDEVVDLMDDAVFAQEARRFIDTFDAKHGGYYTQESLQKLVDRVHERILYTATTVIPAALKQRADASANSKSGPDAAHRAAGDDQRNVDGDDDDRSSSNLSMVVSDIDDDDLAEEDATTFMDSGDDGAVPSSRKRGRTGDAASRLGVFGGEFEGERSPGSATDSE